MITLLTSCIFIFIEQFSIVTILIISVIFFLVLLIVGVRKSYKLQAENERLMNATNDLLKEDNEEYQDFTDGHIYNKNS
ncbi:hypothetical protein KO494_04215 [Lacinutrix sp. C3R15]|uniref:hypothetical protein n=1 Tax=Flavobacteriaceae TaxID=49546 RepID=UPI001C090751|nr:MULTISPECIES: hypothetical protein [Flavobacteriaceae]MBU2938741.1 hypothetical protein [Lacinutrix sp. C3R15]MDO6622054.1 hypothetical protein [Oceanihabitans sp. 1_MG-2023]